MYADILVPIDGSSFSEYAIPYASAIARRSGAKLHVVVVHTSLARHVADISPTRLFQEWEDDYRVKEAKYLDDLVERLRGEGLDAVAETLEGDVAGRLIERAKSKADLLVMATHGRGGLERAWLGSVADEVVHHVRLPVLLVRPPPDETVVAKDVSFSHILVATDGSPAASAATEEAMEIIRLFDARLTILRVVSVPAGLSSPYLPHAALLDREMTESRKDKAGSFLDGLAVELATEATVETRVALAYQPARGILDAIEAVECDLVALGTHRRRSLARMFLGSVADKVVRASPVPVLVGHAEP